MRPTVTLSDAPAAFSLIQKSKIRFRPLYHCDLPLMYAWLSRDFVSRWFGAKPRSYEDVERRYDLRIRSEVPIAPYLMLYDDLPIGYIQTYRLVDRPGYSELIGAGPGTAGVDLFIGERDYLYVGFGTAMLWAFLDRVVFRDFYTARCIAGADVRNRAALRCYEKVGFEFWKLVDIPSKSRAICLMAIGQKAIG
jgi:RimJ/RimL family protein N-acetyltransferase